ncbi:MAG: WD40 repeat domain-containing protein [Rhodospirillales bacterium]
MRRGAGPTTVEDDVRPAAWRATYPAGVTGVCFLSEGHHAVLSFGDGTLRFLTPEADGVAVSEQVRAHAGAVLHLCPDHDGRAALSGGDDGRLVRVSPDGTVEALAAFPGRWIDATAASAAGRMRAVASGREVRLIGADGTVRACAPPAPSTVAALAFNARGKRLALAHYGGVTLHWTANPEGGTPLRWVGSHLAMTWSPDDRHLVTSMQEMALHGWRLPAGKDFRMAGYPAKTRSFSWNAKGALLATAGSDSAVVWDFGRKGPEGRPPQQHGRRDDALVTHVAYNPRHDLLAFAWDDGSVTMAGPSGRTAQVDRLAGRPAGLAWSADGHLLACGTEDGAAALWRMPRG